ncbi:NAD-glutamate dehydrogenase [Lentisphaerota bacterium ZTH]|nr:NAD-glutamate dehydrogenase [Lentisphaerota bacterium]WET05735.1 NAD-glutamate dehydrogenase [Lentisphaerota bacterium ZTH]
MSSASSLLEGIVCKHTEKLKYWYDLLREVMPDYFFKTFSSQQIEEILPLLFNIENEKGIQRIEREDSITLVYLKSEENNLLTTSRMMRVHNIASAVVHESKQKIVINNVPRTLVIEYFTMHAFLNQAGEPVYSKKELAAAFKKKFKKVPSQLDEIYSRINWSSTTDLTIERLVDRLNYAIETQDKDYATVGIEKVGSHEMRLTLARPSGAQRGGFYYKIIEAVNVAGFNIERAYFRDMVYQEDQEDFYHMPVTVNTLYVSSSSGISLQSKKIVELVRELKVLNWTEMLDIFHRELVRKNKFKICDVNLLRSASEFIHSQLAFVDKNAFNHDDINRLMAVYPDILADMVKYFYVSFSPEITRNPKKELSQLKKIEKRIEAINTGYHDKDAMVKTIFMALIDFFKNIRKSNFFSEDKACLAFRMDPAFMGFYDTLSGAYRGSFPSDRPFGVFYFYRENAIGFQVRFSEIARGGWRTVIPRSSTNELERQDAYDFAKDEIFREVFVLAHTQHLKNKDIYEGGSKMIALMRPDEKRDQRATMFEAQRSIATAFMSLINYDKRGKLKDKQIVDKLGWKEIIEIGPDENMFDVMIVWLGAFAQKMGYTLGAGLISGKPDRGINHKEFGVTSFGVHQFFLRTLRELNIDPFNDEFSIKISGGPYGDVAGNELALLLAKENGKYLYKNARIVAITDGPAAVYDPAGLDNEELERLVLRENLDGFSPEKLKGEGAYMVFSKPVTVDGLSRHRLVYVKNGKVKEKMISRDEFMSYFQDNMYNYADVFIPCGGRPSTIDISNWQDYCPNGSNSSMAIVEGANSFITPEARVKLQDAGIIIVKDASANKCGVITSSYEIMSGLMLDHEEFKADKKELVQEIMHKLKNHAEREAEWLFKQFNMGEHTMTELTELLSRQINAKNEEISAYLAQHQNMIQDNIILEHLPHIFAKKYADRISRLPQEYKKAIVSVELATRIVYRQSDSLEQEIKSVI